MKCQFVVAAEMFQITCIFYGRMGGTIFIPFMASMRGMDHDAAWEFHLADMQGTYVGPNIAKMIPYGSDIM